MFAQELKALAKELRVPTILISQLNRVGAKADRPSKNDLKESGDLENAADLILLPWNRTATGEDDVTILVDKFRHGQRLEVPARWIGRHFRFENARTNGPDPRQPDERRGRLTEASCASPARRDGAGGHIRGPPASAFPGGTMNTDELITPSGGAADRGDHRGAHRHPRGPRKDAQVSARHVRRLLARGARPQGPGRRRARAGLAEGASLLGRERQAGRGEPHRDGDGVGARDLPPRRRVPRGPRRRRPADRPRRPRKADRRGSERTRVVSGWPGGRPQMNRETHAN